MQEILRATAHRPWPLPEAWPWVMKQEWHDLLFAHWPIAPDEMRRVVPRQLPVDLFDGKAWIAVTPFRLRGLRPRYLPPPPAGSRFLEINVRTYVTLGGKPGVYFFSLDAESWAAVVGARLGYGLPYWKASMSAEPEAGGMRYRSSREHGPRPAEFAGRYGPTGEPRQSLPGSLEYFLTERYCLYTVSRRRRVVHRAEIHHLPWALQPAAGEIERNSMVQPVGLRLPDTPPLLHFSRALTVLVWPSRAMGSKQQAVGSRQR